MGRQDRAYRWAKADEIDDIRQDKGKKKRRPWGRREGRRDRQAEREAVTDGEREAHEPHYDEGCSA